MSNNLDPDQAQHFVEPDLGPNYFTMQLQQGIKTEKSALTGRVFEAGPQIRMRN